MARVTGTSTTTGATTPTWPRAPQGSTGKPGESVQPCDTICCKISGFVGGSKTPDLQRVSLCSHCRRQSYSSYEESCTSIARREGTGEGILSSGSGEAAGQPKEVTSRWAGVEDKNLQRFGNNPCVPLQLRKEPLCCAALSACQSLGIVAGGF